MYANKRDTHRGLTALHQAHPLYTIIWFLPIPPAGHVNSHCLLQFHERIQIRLLSDRAGGRAEGKFDHFPVNCVDVVVYNSALLSPCSIISCPTLWASYNNNNSSLCADSCIPYEPNSNRLYKRLQYIERMCMCMRMHRKLRHRKIIWLAECLDLVCAYSSTTVYTCRNIRQRNIYFDCFLVASLSKILKFSFFQTIIHSFFRHCPRFRHFFCK